MRLFNFLLGVILIVGVFAFPVGGTVTAQDPCNGLVRSRLQARQTARVMFNDGLGNQLRDNPGQDQSGSSVVGVIPEGTVVTLLQGPICLDGFVWWRVRLPSEAEVWTAEGDTASYFLETFMVGVEVIQPDVNNPRVLRRQYVTFSGEVEERGTLTVPGSDPEAAGALWQQPDIDAANIALSDRRSRCPAVLAGTPWENATTASSVLVPEGEFTYVPAPNGEKVFLVRHRLLQIPTCEGGPGDYYGTSTVHLLESDGISDLFPYGQHGGVQTKNACLTPEVINPNRLTDLSEITWSPDGDTVALTVRYLDQSTDGRGCAFYFIFLIDVFNGNVIPVGEGRRAVWGSGGTVLHFFTFDVDTGYNITDERLWRLSDGQVTELGLPEGAQFVPRVFNATGVQLPSTEDGRQLLACNTISGCPDTLTFEISDRTFTPAIEVPEDLLPREISQIHYVAGNTRLLWLDINGNVYVQAVSGPDAGLWTRVALDGVIPATSRIVDIILMPTGGTSILMADTGEYILLNTVSRSVELIPELSPGGSSIPANTDEATDTTETTE